MSYEQIVRIQIPELTVVELVKGLPEHGLTEGERGTVVDLYNRGEAYEVEFVDADGSTRALLTLNADQIRLAPSIGTGARPSDF